MWKVLSLLQRNRVWSIPISMALGLRFGFFFDACPLLTKQASAQRSGPPYAMQ
jgi:hypothetical protein